MSMVISGDNGLTFPAGSTQVQAGNFQTMVNRIINGRMEIDQRNAGASVTVTDTSNLTYTLDRWSAFGSSSSKFSVQQVSDAPIGFINSLKITSLAATTVNSSDQYTIGQIIEGLNVADLAWGTANAKTVTLSFWVRSSLTGTFGGAIVNSGFARGYGFTYSISVADTWEYKTVTVAGDTTGTWLTTNGQGINIRFGLGVGSTLSAPVGSWSAGSYRSATGATSVVGTNGATFYITGVDLRVGSYTVVPQDFRAYGTELALCQRYYYKDARDAFSMWASGVFYTTTSALVSYSLPVQMRATPTLSSSTISNFRVQGGGYVLNASALSSSLSSNGGRIGFTVSGATQGQGAVVDTASSGQFLEFSAEL